MKFIIMLVHDDDASWGTVMDVDITKAAQRDDTICSALVGAAMAGFEKVLAERDIDSTPWRELETGDIR